MPISGTNSARSMREDIGYIALPSNVSKEKTGKVSVHRTSPVANQRQSNKNRRDVSDRNPIVE